MASLFWVYIKFAAIFGVLLSLVLALRPNPYFKHSEGALRSSPKPMSVPRRIFRRVLFYVVGTIVFEAICATQCRRTS